MKVDYRYARLAKLLSVAAMILVISPLLFAFISPAFGVGVGILLSMGLPAALVAFGYGLQALTGYITGFKRRDGIFDVGTKFVDPLRAVVPMIVALAAYIPFYRAFKAYRIATDGYLDPYAFDLFAIPLLGTIAIALGVVLWFYPYHKLLHPTMIYGYGAAFFAVAIITGLFSVSTLFHGICFAVFVLIFFVVSNLRNIEESIYSAKMRVPSNDFRSYNLYLTLRYCLIIFLVMGVLFSVVYLLTANITFSPIDTSEDAEAEEGVAVYELVEGVEREPGRDIERESDRKTRDKPSTIEIICAIVVVLFFTVVVAYWLWRMHVINAFFVFVFNIFRGIGYFVLSVLRFFESKVDPDIPVNYVDTESTIDCDTAFDSHYIIEELTPKSFEARLEKKEGLTEKFAYAYSVYCSLIQGDEYGIKPSDTPRILTARLGVHRKNDLDIATPVYEEIRYRLAEPDCEVMAYQLRQLTELVKSRLRIM